MIRTLTILIALAAVTGCAREIDIENQDASVTSIGPIDLNSAGNVVVPFTVRDHEGDDQTVLVQICDAPDEGCGTAVVAPGSDPLDRLPTVPRRTDVLHEFRWDVWCGRWFGQELEPSDLDSEYVVRIEVITGEAEPVYSEPFSLSGLGATEEGSCD